MAPSIGGNGENMTSPSIQPSEKKNKAGKATPANDGRSLAQVS